MENISVKKNVRNLFVCTATRLSCLFFIRPTPVPLDSANAFLVCKENANLVIV